MKVKGENRELTEGLSDHVQKVDDIEPLASLLILIEWQIVTVTYTEAISDLFKHHFLHISFKTIIDSWTNDQSVFH